MENYENWFNRVTYSLSEVLENEIDNSKNEKNKQFEIANIIYSHIHLHGMDYNVPDFSDDNSILEKINPKNPYFMDRNWEVFKDIGEYVLLHRRGIEVSSPKNHNSLLYSSKSKFASIKHSRIILSVMPGWDRIISSRGWPAIGDTRIYLPTTSDPDGLRELITVLDSTDFKWHLKSTRQKYKKRPDSVVLYIDSETRENFLELISDTIPSGTGSHSLPGFSLLCGDKYNVSIGIVQEESKTVSYGWSISNYIANIYLKKYKNSAFAVKEISKKLIKELLFESSKGNTDVKFPW